MEITRVSLRKSDGFNPKVLAYCSVVLDDCLKLDGIGLCKQEDSDFYLILPSRQEIYKEVKHLNKGIKIVFPKNRKTLNNPNRKKFEEFYYPVDSSFYEKLLNKVVDEYSSKFAQDEE